MGDFYDQVTHFIPDLRAKLHIFIQTTRVIVRNSYQNTIFFGKKNYYYQIMCIFAHELSTNTK